MQWPALGGEGPTAVPCKTCSVLLCVLEQPRVYNSNWLALRIYTCLYQRIFTIYTNITMALSTYLVYPHECAPVSITVSVISTHIYTCLYSRISTRICTCLYHCIFTIRTNIPCLNQRIFNIHTNMHLSVPTYGFYPHKYAPVCTHVWFLSTWICTCLYPRMVSVHMNMHLSVPTYGFCPHEYAPIGTHVWFLSTWICICLPTYGFCSHEYAHVCTHVWFLHR
jgi:hypothetical protein